MKNIAQNHFPIRHSFECKFHVRIRIATVREFCTYIRTKRFSWLDYYNKDSIVLDRKELSGNVFLEAVVNCVVADTDS